jgi:hypothetical protein
MISLLGWIRAIHLPFIYRANHSKIQMLPMSVQEIELICSKLRTKICFPPKRLAYLKPHPSCLASLCKFRMMAIDVQRSTSGKRKDLPKSSPLKSETSTGRNANLFRVSNLNS